MTEIEKRFNNDFTNGSGRVGTRERAVVRKLFLTTSYGTL